MFPSGTYECGFTTGTIRHTASIPIKVVLLPDVITMKFSPLIADCSGKNPSITVTATIPKSEEAYKYYWNYNGINEQEQNGKRILQSFGHLLFLNLNQLPDRNNNLCVAANNLTSFNYPRQLDCAYTGPQVVKITFKNNLGQEATAAVEIPVFRGIESIQLDTVDTILLTCLYVD